MRSPRALGLSARMQLRLRSDWPHLCLALSRGVGAGGRMGWSMEEAGCVLVV